MYTKKCSACGNEFKCNGDNGDHPNCQKEASDFYCCECASCWAKHGSHFTGERCFGKEVYDACRAVEVL